MLTDIQRNFNVFLGGQRWYQVERLEDHTDLTVADSRKFTLSHACDIDAINEHLPGSRIIQPGDQVEDFL